MSKAFSRFRQFGGWKLVREYKKMGILGLAIKEGIKCIFRKQSAETAYSKLGTRINLWLNKRYGNYLEEKYTSYKSINTTHQVNKTIWFCWLQGIENAPLTVRACLTSIQQNFKDWNIIVLSVENYKQYATLPEFIEQKYHKGYIPKALFTDLLRLELLIRHGGTWIDSTVLCTGRDAMSDKVMIEPLFFFRYFDKKSGKMAGLSNWFISSQSNNPLLMAVRDTMFRYWEENDCTVQYYLMHLLMYLSISKFPEIDKAMPRGNSNPCLLLRDRLTKDFVPEEWETIQKHVCFHKLNYRLEEKAHNNTNSYFNKVVKPYIDHAVL